MASAIRAAFLGNAAPETRGPIGEICISGAIRSRAAGVEIDTTISLRRGAVVAASELKFDSASQQVASPGTIIFHPST
jgi:hypothetical protein